MTNDSPHYLDRADGTRIAYHAVAGTAPGVLFLGGFMSDMTGSKATALEAHCRATGRAFVRFDYFGHGASSGAFRDGTLGRWRDDALLILDTVAAGSQVLVGSSMGGWIALLVALARPERIAGLVGVAAAPDFTRELMWPSFSAAERLQLETEGHIEQPSDYGDGPYIITRQLIEEADNYILLDRPLPISCPVRLLHGLEDRDVPWELALRLSGRLATDDVTLTLIKGGDHRLSEPPHIERLCATVEELVKA